MRRKCIALALAGLLLLACAACGTAPKPRTGPFMFARRILTHGDLSHDSEGAPVVEPGEVLVFFTYMEPFDAEAAQASTTIYTTWVAEAVDHTASLDYTGEQLRKPESGDGAELFSSQADYGFGIAVSETWMLPEEEYKAAYSTLMAAAHGMGGKTAWLVHSQGRGGHRSQSCNKNLSFYVQSYLPEQLRQGAQAVHMSTELMRKHFPFLGSKI